VPASSATRLLVAALSALVLGSSACAGAVSGGEQKPGRSDASAGPSRLVSPAEFATAISKPGTAVINVHVPFEGEIPGTDRHIPFDQVERRRAALPPPSRPLAIYCRTGPMSATAARALARLGYREITELRGGMRAWQDSGRPLRDRPA